VIGGLRDGEYEIAVFWDAMLYSLVDRSQNFAHITLYRDIKHIFLQIIKNKQHKRTLET
jgi:hypothetical protein